MNNVLPISNAPLYSTTPKTGFQEVWYMRLNQLDAIQALWLRFTVLLRADHSKEVSEVWAIFFNVDGNVTRKIGLKRSWPLNAFTQTDVEAFYIADSCLLASRTEGPLKDDQNCIRWSLSFVANRDCQNDFVPASLRRLGLVKNVAWTVHERLLFDGWSEVNGERQEWSKAPGMQGHLAGPKNGHSWAWGHCNHFVDESGAPAQVVWDGLCARARLGVHAAPPLSSMLIQAGNHTWRFNTLRDAWRIHSAYDYEGWRFRARKEGHLFEGRITARRDDYAGVTYEDTDGSLLYCHNAKICDMLLEITGPDGNRRRYQAERNVAYEVVDRAPHPDIMFVI